MTSEHHHHHGGGDLDGARGDKHHEDATVSSVPQSVMQHSDAMHGMPRNIRITTGSADRRQKAVHLRLADLVNNLSYVQAKNIHERNDVVYYTKAAGAFNTVTLIVSLMSVDHGLAAVCLLAYGWYALAFVPYLAQRYLKSRSALIQHFVFPVGRFAGGMLVATYSLFCVLWLVYSESSPVFTYAFEALQLCTTLMCIGAWVALCNMESAFYGWMAAWTAFKRLRTSVQHIHDRTLLTPTAMRLGRHAAGASHKNK